VRIVSGFDTASAFAAAIETDTRSVKGQTVRITFRARPIQSQLFRKIKGRDRWRNILYFSHTTYTGGRLFIDAVIYEYVGGRRPYQKFPQIRCSIPLSLAVSRAVAQKAVKQAALSALEVELTGKVGAVTKLGADDYAMELADAQVTLRALDDTFFNGKARTIEPAKLPPSKASELRAPEFKQETVLEMEAENSPELQLYADWERDLTGWYARKLTRGCSGRAMALVHSPNSGATFTVRLENPLPPGLYRVEVEAVYTSARLRANIIEARLGDGSVRIAWFYGKRNAWMISPAVNIREPARALVVKAVQAGGGGLNEAPTMEEMVIMLDRLRIVRVEGGRP